MYVIKNPVKVSFITVIRKVKSYSQVRVNFNNLLNKFLCSWMEDALKTDCGVYGLAVVIDSY